jgi:hypothetical protein
VSAGRVDVGSFRASTPGASKSIALR